MRRIYLINMNLSFSSSPHVFSMDNDYVNQFRYTQHMIIGKGYNNGGLNDDIILFIISHCPCLHSIDLCYDSDVCYITDHT